MEPHRIVTGPLSVNTYILVDQGECLVVDPGSCKVLDLVEDAGCRRILVVVTHGHFDHVGGVDCLKNGGAVLAAHRLEPMVARASVELARVWGLDAGPQESGVDVELGDGDTIRVGRIAFKVYHTPGHSPDHLILYSPGAGIAFTGDLIFRGSIGRVDLPGSDPRAMSESLRRVKELIPGDTILYPGHGVETEMALELETNPYLIHGLDWLL